MCSPEVLHAWNNQDDYIKPRSEWPETKPGKVMCSDEEFQKIADHLFEDNIFDYVLDEELPRDNRGVPILAGMFAVLKSLGADGLQITRLIFYLVANNAVQNMLVGGLMELPSALPWEQVVLEDDEYVRISGEDIKSSFYLVELPRPWRTWMAVNKMVWRKMENKWKRVWPTAAVVPMGWCSAVGVMQHIHRRLVAGMCKPPHTNRGLPLSAELRRSQAFPVHYGGMPHWYWSAYVDDWEQVNKYRLKNLGTDKGGPSREQNWVRDEFEDFQVPRSDKAVEMEVRAASKGSQVDGKAGWVMPTTVKVSLVLPQTGYVLSQTKSPINLWQQVLGRWVPFIEHRRHTGCVLDLTWKEVSHSSGRVKLSRNIIPW